MQGTGKTIGRRLGLVVSSEIEMEGVKEG